MARARAEYELTVVDKTAAAFDAVRKRFRDTTVSFGQFRNAVVGLAGSAGLGLVIRQQIGFDGLLFTDDLDMEALSGSVPERAARAIAAGCDLALNCWAKMADMTGIADALPALSAKGHERLERALAIDTTGRSQASQGELLATRDALLAQVHAA